VDSLSLNILHDFEACHSRHIDVHEHQIRFFKQDHFMSFKSIGGKTDDVKISARFLNDRFQSISNDGFIVADEQFIHRKSPPNIILSQDITVY